MNFSDIFRSFFGLNRSKTGPDSSKSQNDFRNPIWNIDDDDDTDDELHHNYRGEYRNGNIRGGFHVFANPLEIHKYFERQMNDIMKSFGGMMGETNLPGLEELPARFLEPPEKESLRDQYLRSGFNSWEQWEKNSKRNDSEITPKEFMDSLFDKNKENSKPTEGHSQVEKFSPNNDYAFYGHTILRRSITLPDGNIETTQTIKSSDGREETTVTISPPGSAHIGIQMKPFDEIWKNIFRS